MVDVTIRGAGIFGLSIAWACLKKGASVRVVDPFGVAAGSSGGLVGALAPHTPDQWNPKKQFQFESLLAASQFWTDVEGTSGLSSGYARLGRVQALADDRAVELARARAEAAAENWKGVAQWRVDRAKDLEHWVPRSPSDFVVVDTLSARLHPRKASNSLAAAISIRGGEIVAEADDEGAVVWATGWEGLLELSERFGKIIGNGVKGQSVCLHLDAHHSPQIFADGLHIIPHADGTVAIGSTSERDFDAPDTTDAKVDALLEKAMSIAPVLHGAREVSRWAGVRPRAISRAPILGAWPGRDRHFVANGGFKIGFGMAPKIADVMADLVLLGRDLIPDAFRFDP